MDYPCNDSWVCSVAGSVEGFLFTIHCTIPGVHRVLVTAVVCHCVQSAASGGCCPLSVLCWPGPASVPLYFPPSSPPPALHAALCAVYGRHVPPISSGRPCIFHIVSRLPTLTSPFSSVTPCQSGLAGRFGEKQRDLFLAKSRPFSPQRPKSCR